MIRLMRVAKEINEGRGMRVDKIVICGPGNSLVKHGGTQERGYGPEICDKRIVSEDGVHLSIDSNKSAAVFLCRRFLDGEMLEFPEGKRRRLF